MAPARVRIAAPRGRGRLQGAAPCGLHTATRRDLHQASRRGKDRKRLFRIYSRRHPEQGGHGDQSNRRDCDPHNECELGPALTMWRAIAHGEFSLSANDRPALGATVAETGVLECDWSHSETGVSEHESEGRDSPRLRANSNELILLLDVQENWRPDLDLNQAMRPCTVPASPLRHRAVARGRTDALANKVNGLG
jgi:hypothetical protein